MSRARENADGARLDAPLASPEFTGTVAGVTGTHITTGTLGNTVQDNITRLGTVTSGTWNGSIIGTAYGGNLVKTGSQTWSAEGSKYINACFSATYKSYLVNGSFWLPTGTLNIHLQFTSGTDTPVTTGYEYGLSGINMDGTVGNYSGTGATSVELESSFSAGAGKTLAFSFLTKNTHVSIAEASMMGQMLSENNFRSGGMFQITQATTMVGLRILISANLITGWVNVYGILE